MEQVQVDVLIMALGLKEKESTTSYHALRSLHIGFLTSWEFCGTGSGILTCTCHPYQSPPEALCKYPHTSCRWECCLWVHGQNFHCNFLSSDLYLSPSWKTPDHFPPRAKVLLGDYAQGNFHGTMNVPPGVLVHSFFFFFLAQWVWSYAWLFDLVEKFKRTDGF